MKSIVGRKAGMTQVFAADGQAYAVTVVEVLPNVVVYKKTKAKEGYDALQVAYDEKKESRANKCEKGIAKKANIKVPGSLHELKGDEIMNLELVRNSTPQSSRKVIELMSLELLKVKDLQVQLKDIITSLDLKDMVLDSTEDLDHSLIMVDVTTVLFLERKWQDMRVTNLLQF